jgi:prepilin signal peptidase PulO-like enzyme (type II secretory pathway)
LAKKFGKNKRIPFIPFMSVGLVLSSLPFTIN